MLYRRGELERMGGELTDGLPIDGQDSSEGGSVTT
jgi:hypothetical protein